MGAPIRLGKITHVKVMGNGAGDGSPEAFITLAEFAKLFTYGRTLHYEGGEIIGETYDIRVAETPTGGQEK